MPEVEGNQLDRSTLLEAVKQAVSSGETELNLSDSGCYLKPSVYQDDEALNTRVNNLNQLVAANLTMDFGSGRTETVNGALLKTGKIEVQEKGRECAVVDTTGAGDSFWGGLLYQFAQNDEKPETLTEENAKVYVRFANAVAGLCVERRGSTGICRESAYF